MGIDRKERICIVGAGAAGLSAAVHLRDAGFGNIVVLEKEKEVGGKCRSFRRDGKTWELGAVLATTDYKVTLDLMGRVGIGQWRAGDPCREVDRSYTAEGIYPFECLFPGWVKRSEFLPAIWQMVRYHALGLRWPAVFAPGHAGVPAELAEPFSAWVERWGMDKLAKLYAIPFTAYGYGYYDEVPAAYVLKFFDPGLTRSLALNRKFFNWKEGVQELWERTARGFAVRAGVGLESVRRGEGVEVAWREPSGEGRRERFDRLILACPLDEALGFLDAGEEERSLFSAIEHTDYRVRLIEAEGLRVPAGFVPGRFDRSGIGRPLIWDERIHGAGVSTFYVLADGAMGDAEVDRRIEEDIRRLGGTPRATLAAVNWKYFPHVGSEAYRGGWYRRFEALQGERRTYLTGEIASFSTVERSARYSKDLVRRFFA